MTIGCVCWDNTRSASLKFTFDSCSSFHPHWKSRGNRLSVSRCSSIIGKLPSNEMASWMMWGTYKGAGVIVVCINEEQSARRVARSGLAVPLTPRRQLLALHDPRSAMTLEKALLTVVNARIIVVLFMIETLNSNSESESMQDSQIQSDHFDLTDYRKEETVAVPLNKRIPKLICSLDLPASKQSMFGNDPSSDHTDLAYSNKIEFVLRIQSMDMDLGPLPKLTSLSSCGLRLIEAWHCKTTAFAARKE